MRRTTLLAAWLYTGPLGHLYGTLADVVELWSRWIWFRLTGSRRPGSF